MMLTFVNLVGIIAVCFNKDKSLFQCTKRNVKIKHICDICLNLNNCKALQKRIDINKKKLRKYNENPFAGLSQISNVLTCQTGQSLLKRL